MTTTLVLNNVVRGSQILIFNMSNVILCGLVCGQIKDYQLSQIIFNWHVAQSTIKIQTVSEYTCKHGSTKTGPQI